MLDVGRWFDRDWYLHQNPDVARAGIDPLAHYVRYGEAEGRRPSPWFEPSWYRAAYAIPDNQFALEHFLNHRATRQFLPHPALYLVPHLAPWRDDIAAGIDPFDHYLSDHLVSEHELLPELPTLRASGLIDVSYHQINGSGEYEAALDPVLHYSRFGWRQGARPNGVFDPGWYLTVNLDVARLRINPLLHYILEGEAANRRPVLWFDPVWYRTAYDVPAETLALAHYLMLRHSGTVSPNALFDTGWYQERYGAMMPSGVDPFSHYLAAGAMRDIDPSPRFSAASWRHRHMAPREARSWRELPMLLRNPLVHHMTLTYGNGP